MEDFIYSNYIDPQGRPIERTPQTHPYNYDTYVLYQKGSMEDCDITAYHDRMRSWDYDKYTSLKKKWFDKEGDYFDNIGSDKIQNFLRDYFDDPNLELIILMKGCNQSNGYPFWWFGMRYSKIK